MIPEYHFHSDHGPATNTRWLSLLLFGAAILLVVAAIYEFYLYFNQWVVGDHMDSVWQLILGVVYLGISGIVAYWAAQRRSRKDTPPERFVTIKDGVMTYQLDQLNGKQKVDLKELTAVSRLSVRDMVLELRGGRQVVMPVYLIDDEDKQAELESLLQATAGRQAGG